MPTPSVRETSRGLIRRAGVERVATGTMHFNLADVHLGMSALSHLVLRNQDCASIVERRRRKVPLRVPPTLLVGVSATAVAVLVGAVLAWMGIDRLSSRTGPPLLVTGGFLILAAAFAPAFKLLDLAVRLTGRTLLRIGGEKSRRQPQPARRRPQLPGVVVVVMSACGIGEGWSPTATRPAKCG